MLAVFALLSSFYVEHRTGQLAGMGNVVLEPAYVIGTTNELDLESIPRWHNYLDLYAIDGAALTGSGTTKNEIQEVRAKFISAYTVYNNDDIFSFNTGLYSLWARPTHHYLPYLDPSAVQEYATEEDDVIRGESLLGLDLNFNVREEKIHSTFHNIFYLSGKRIAPNLLTYQPTLGFDWNNEVYLWGTQQEPKLSFTTNVDFWFARKANVKLINVHDGVGGTKREVYLEYGLRYYIKHDMSVYLATFGYNNLNRGSSQSEPAGFRDGSMLEFKYSF